MDETSHPFADNYGSLDTDTTGWATVSPTVTRTVKEWTDEEVQRVIRYGVCTKCGAPRDARLVTEPGKPPLMEMYCTGCGSDGF